MVTAKCWYPGTHFVTHYNHTMHIVSINNLNMSESDILGPIDYFSDIENLVSFERALFADYNC